MDRVYKIRRSYSAYPVAFFMLLSIVLFSLPSFAQEQKPALENQEQQEAPTAPSTPAKQLMVTAIEVIGNNSISTNTIVSKMKTRVGSPYQENIISDDLKRLYLLGFFDEGTRIDTEDYKGGVKVIVTVVERPVIERITFSGVKRIGMTIEKLKANLKSKETQYLDYPSLEEDIRTMKNMYEKRGYSGVEISYTVNPGKEASKVRVQFNVVESKKTIIKNILVEGNKAFSDRRILKLMKTKRAWFFNAGILKEEVLKEDIERIKAFYRKSGYADVAVDYEVKPDSRRPYLLYIYIRITEGKKYLVGNVSIEGNENISEKDILAQLKECTPGAVFSQDALRDDVTNIQSLYFDRGYVMAHVQENASLNTYTGRTDIAYNIIENDIAYVDKIKIRGNVKTKDLVIRRELRIMPGDRFDGEKLRRSKERLQNLGFFDEISYDTEDTNTPNKKNLVVEVKETKTGAFSFGGGYSSVDDFVGFVEIEQKNFDWRNFPYFTGDGQDLRVRASFGTLSDSFNLSFTEPWIFDYPVSFGFDLYKEERQRESDVGYGYDEDITGGSLRLGKEISEYLRASLRYRYDVIDITNITEDATYDLKKEYGQNAISSMEFGITFDTRDNVFNPLKGDIISSSIECAGGPLAGDKDFLKFFSRMSHYFPLWRKSSLEIRARIGLADAYGDSDEVPIYERYFAGGAYTIRGYHERKVGPIDPVSKDPLGGESMIIGNVEYTYPIFDFFKLAAFYDTGNVWAKVGDIGSTALKSGVGVGIRVKTPIGPLMLDYGIPLDKEPGEEEKGSGRFHFNMSHGF